MAKRFIFEKILIAPVLSEKANVMREQGKYIFRVDLKSSKIQIKEAIRKLFNIYPISCTVMVVGGKPKRQRYRSGYTADWKKVIIRLPEGKKIGLFEGI